jgi:hypothetical protein
VTVPTGALAHPPEPHRPTTPGVAYGVPASGGSFIPWDHVIERLAAASGYWLATANASGRPHVVPIWGVLVRDDLYLEIGSSETAKSRNLAGDRRVQVHLDGVDDVVLIVGRAQPIAPEPPLGAAIADAMAAKYPGYHPGPSDWDDGGLVLIVPRTILAWRDMPTATRWRFDEPD